VATTKPHSGSALLYAFGLPFCVFGVAMLGFATYQTRAGGTNLAAYSALSGVIFAGIGIGIVLTLRHGVRTQAAIDRLREQHPDAPWLWREEWATGRIFSEGSANALAAWLFATFWNAVSWPIFYFVYFNPSPSFGVFGSFTILSAIFPLTGIVLIGLAIRATMRWVASRGSYLEMATIPAQIGGTLIGTVRLMPPSRANREFKVTLSCISRSSSESSKVEEVIWSNAQTVRGSSFSGIHVEFQIPPEYQPTDAANADSAIVWRLMTAAPFSSRNFEAAFEVPVFNVARVPAPKRAAGLTPEADAKADTFEPPPNFPVRTRQLPTGATEFYFPPCRAPAAAIGATLFTAGWSAMFLMIVHIDAPIVFDAVWAALDVFMLLWVGSLWLSDTRVTIDGSSITIARGIPGLVLSRRTIPASEVHTVAAIVGSRTGSTTYYRLRLTHDGDRKVTFGDGLREKRAVEWLAYQIARHLGVTE
jgi:hypothetical protein